jgi:Ca-activated chloride channel family protein
MRSRARTAAASVAVLVAVLVSRPASAFASGLVTPAPPAGAGAPAASLAPLRSLAVDARLGATTATITERRTYVLPSGVAGPVTVTYHHSAPGAGAPVVTVAGAALSGSVLAPAAADAARRDLTRALGDPAPLRELGTPLFVSTPVAVSPGAVEVVVSTTVPLTPHGTLRGVTVPLDWARPPIGTLDVQVTASTEAPLRALYSPFHELDVVRDGARAAHATHAGQSVCTDFDLTLLVSDGEGPVHVDLLPFRYGADEGGFFLALVTPDPTPVEADVLPRDLVFVLDTSGSMSGVKLTQAKQALRGVLSGLRPADSFALISFADGVRTFQPAAVPADAAHVAAAASFVDGLQADGGTNISDALRAAFASLPSGAGHPRYVVFLTDGQPTVGVTSVDAIASMAVAANEAGARLYAFGIGDDVNTVLLDRLARQSSGDVFYVRPTQSVSDAVESFFERLSAPVLANPRLGLEAFGVADLYPPVLPDLFAGRTVTLLGRYAAPGRATVALAGARAGQPWTAGFDVTLPAYALGDGAVPRIWAARHVARLLTDIKQGNTDPMLAAEVQAVASRFGVTTAFTTFAPDARGDVALRYTGVPMAATGTVAVDTSSALSGYGHSDAVQAGAPADTSAVVRYVSDRSLPRRGGYLTDTKLTGMETFVDLAFGSERYFAFADTEAPWGAAGLLATGANARFELLGRAFRVSDPAAPPAGASPPLETADVPGPSWRPIEDPTPVAPVDVPASSSAAGPGPAADGGVAIVPDVDGAGGPSPVPASPDLVGGGGGCACNAGPARGGGAAAIAAAALASLAARRRAKRRRHRAGT